MANFIIHVYKYGLTRLSLIYILICRSVLWGITIKNTHLRIYCAASIMK
jgi:hypothetical protein